jgi:hypothetical protein
VYHGERLNSYTHLLGAVAAAAGLAVLVVLAAQQGDFWKLVSFSVYGATLFLLYLLLYHSTRGAKPISKLDHAHLSAHRRQLYAVHPGHAARYLGVDAVWPDLGAGSARDRGGQPAQ